MQGKSRLLVILLLALFSFGSVAAQEKKEAKDSLVRLVDAKSAHLQEIDGISYRKVIGPARFLHNNTYLICDTALWNVNTNVINAVGNVQVIQDNTFLTSDKIDYIVEENLAQFRGSLVELYDKEGNVLRTKYLDYNTKDSIAVFYSGGVMRNADGNLIESSNGEYRSVDKMFSFIGNVQMFTDSVFIKSTKVDYNTVTNKAFFGRGTTAWQEDNMLFANDGEFDRPENTFYFKKDSYILTKDQEIWSDTLIYSRITGVADLYNNIQILDTVQKAYCFADEAVYTPEPFAVVLTRKPSVALYNVEDGVRDTVFLAADTLKYYTRRYCDIESAIIEQAKERKELSDLDPLENIEAVGAALRKKNEEAAKNPFVVKPKSGGNKNRENAGNQQGNDPAAPFNPVRSGGTDGGGRKSIDITGKGSSAFENPWWIFERNERLQDSLAINGPLVAEDTVAAADSQADVVKEEFVVKDTSAVVFIDAWHKVKVFKNDIQALCDSMRYTGIDSIARLYIDPVVWNAGKHQFTSDSMQLVIKGRELSKANLISNAFVASQEDTVYYNQIKGAEMVAYFKDNDVYRFDALGGASMNFYMREDSIVTIMNQKEGKILSARIKERQIQRIKYVEGLKNNALPVYNLPIEEQRLRGFNWRGDERPVSRYEVCDREIRESRRGYYMAVPFPEYPYAAEYFPDTRDEILRYKAESDSLRAAAELARLQEQERREQMERAMEPEKEHNKQDSLLSISIESADVVAEDVADKVVKEKTTQAKAKGSDASARRKLKIEKKIAVYKERLAVYDERMKSAEPGSKEFRRAEKRAGKLRRKIRKLEAKC